MPRKQRLDATAGSWDRLLLPRIYVLSADHDGLARVTAGAPGDGIKISFYIGFLATIICWIRT